MGEKWEADPTLEEANRHPRDTGQVETATRSADARSEARNGDGEKQTDRKEGTGEEGKEWENMRQNEWGPGRETKRRWEEGRGRKENWNGREEGGIVTKEQMSSRKIKRSNRGKQRPAGA